VQRPGTFNGSEARWNGCLLYGIISIPSNAAARQPTSPPFGVSLQKRRSAKWKPGRERHCEGRLSAAGRFCSGSCELNKGLTVPKQARAAEDTWTTSPFRREPGVGFYPRGQNRRSIANAGKRASRRNAGAAFLLVSICRRRQRDPAPGSKRRFGPIASLSDIALSGWARTECHGRMLLSRSPPACKTLATGNALWMNPASPASPFCAIRS
jgi:hypothetical protein